MSTARSPSPTAVAAISLAGARSEKSRRSGRGRVWTNSISRRCWKTSLSARRCWMLVRLLRLLCLFRTQPPCASAARPTPLRAPAQSLGAAADVTGRERHPICSMVVWCCAWEVTAEWSGVGWSLTAGVTAGAQPHCWLLSTPRPAIRACRHSTEGGRLPRRLLVGTPGIYSRRYIS